MKKLIQFILIAGVCLPSRASNVYFALTNAYGGQSTNAVMVTPVLPTSDGGFLVTGQPQRFPKQGPMPIPYTNWFEIGTYQLQVVSPNNIWSVPVYFTVPNDTNTYNVLSLIGPPISTNNSLFYAYSQAASDLRYALIGTSGADTNALHSTNNLSDVASASTARANLGLGTAAQANVGIGANDIPQYDGAGNLAVYDTFTLANGSAFYFDNGSGFLYSQNGGTVSAVTTIPLNEGGTGQTTAIAAITALGGPYQPTNSSLTTLSGGVATPILGTSSTTALAGNTTAATLGAIAANAGAGTNNSLVNPTLSGIESNTGSGTYIGTNLFTGSNIFSGGAAISAISGNAQGGLITNLDSAIFNVKDYGNNINNAYAAMTNTSAAGVLYFPATSSSWTTSTKMIVGPNLQSGDGPAFTLRGSGTGDGGIGWTGANSVVFDSTGYQGLGLNFEHLRAVNNIGTSTGTNSFYIEERGGIRAVRWDDLLLSQWLVGAEPSQSGADISALQLRNNAVGLWLPYQSDIDFINVSLSVGNTNAAIYADSQSHHIQLNSAGDNIGVIFDRGGGSILSGGAESITNAFATYGDPSNLPSWFTNNANAAGMQGLTIENGYMIGGGVTNANSQGYPALVKIYNNSAAAPINIRNFEVTSADVVVFRTNVDSIQPINFDGVTVNASNLADFSDGTFLTSATASGLTTGHVGLNTTEQEFTKSTLEYGRDRSGNLYVNGTLSNRLLAPSLAGGVVTTTGAGGSVDYGLQVGASLNAAVSFNQQVAPAGYPTTTALPAFVFAGPQYFEGFGPNDTSTGFMRLGPANAPFDGSGSTWYTFGSHALSGLVVDAPAGIGLNVAQASVTHSLEVSGTTAANFHQGIATMEDVSGSITATGWTNALGTNAWVWPFGTAVSYVITDAAGTAIVTNVTISTTDASMQPIQAGGKITAASGLSGRYQAQ